MSWVEIRQSTSKDVLLICSSTLRSSLVLAYPLSHHASQLWVGQANFSSDEVVVTAEAGEGWPLMTVVERRRNEIAVVDHFRAPAEHQHRFSSSRAAEQDQWVILLKAGSMPNGNILVAPLMRPRERSLLVAHSDEVCLEDLAVYANFVAVSGRQEGYQVVYVLANSDLARCLMHAHANGCSRREGQAGDAAAAAVRGGRGGVGAPDDLNEPCMYRVRSSEEVFVMGLTPRPSEYESRRLRFTYSSPICPTLTCECSIPECVPSGMGVGEEPVRQIAQGRGGWSDEAHRQTPLLWLEMPGSKVVCVFFFKMIILFV